MGMKYRDPNTQQLKELSLKAADTLPIGTIVDYDGEDVPEGWEEVDDILWENSNPSQAFAEQTITLESNNYRSIKWCFYYSTSTQDYYIICESIKGKGFLHGEFGYASGKVVRRKADYIDDTHYKIYGCLTSDGADNGYLIPVMAIAVK